MLCFDGMIWNTSWMKWNYKQEVLGFVFFIFSTAKHLIQSTKWNGWERTCKHISTVTTKERISYYLLKLAELSVFLELFKFHRGTASSTLATSTWLFSSNVLSYIHHTYLHYALPLHYIKTHMKYSLEEHGKQTHRHFLKQMEFYYLIWNIWSY